MKTTANGTYEIPAENFLALDNRIAKIAKRASKLGCGAVGLEVLGERKVEVKAPGDVNIVVGYRTVVDVRIVGESPKLGGWTFVATLQHGEDGNIVRTVPGVTVDTVAYRNAAPACDHCKLNRRRNDTFVVVHEDGRLVQVGRDCIADFFGGQSPDLVAARAQFLIDCAVACEDGESYGGRAVLEADTLAFLAFVACTIRADGWMSRGKARDTNRMASVDIAWTLGAFPSPMVPERDRMHPTDQDRETAVKALEYAREELGAANPTTLGDYEYNLRTVIMADTVSARTAGIAGSVLPWFSRRMGDIAERQATAASAHVGAVGDKLSIVVTLERVHSFDSQFGTTHMHKFRDAAGNVVVWKTGSELLDAGKSYRLNGTVKAHDDYKGVKQTVMTRCAACPPDSPEWRPKAKRAKRAA